MCRMAQVPIGSAAASASASVAQIGALAALLLLPPSIALASNEADTLSIAPKLYFQLVAWEEARKAGVPYALVDAVMKIESDYQPGATGTVGEIGLMQVRPATAALLGFSGAPTALATPAINIHYGTMYLSEAWRLTGGDLCRTLMKYRAGHGTEVASALSVDYCRRAQEHLAHAGATLPTIVEPGSAALNSGALASVRPASVPGGIAAPRRPLRGRAFWASFESRIRRINASLEAKWRRYAVR